MSRLSREWRASSEASAASSVATCSRRLAACAPLPASTRQPVASSSSAQDTASARLHGDVRASAGGSSCWPHESGMAPGKAPATRPPRPRAAAVCAPKTRRAEAAPEDAEKSRVAVDEAEAAAAAEEEEEEEEEEGAVVGSGDRPSPPPSPSSLGACRASGEKAAPMQMFLGGGFFAIAARRRHSAHTLVRWSLRQDLGKEGGERSLFG